MSKGRRNHYRHEPLVNFDAPLPPQPAAPARSEPRVAPHAAGCWCTACFNAGLRFGEYLKQKRLNEL
jgi:hypothetical protein